MVSLDDKRHALTSLIDKISCMSIIPQRKTKSMQLQMKIKLSQNLSMKEDKRDG